MVHRRITRRGAPGLERTFATTRLVYHPRERFKPRATEAIAEVMAPASIYSWRDVCAGRSTTEWAQNMLRDAQATEITGTTTLLRLVWTRIAPTLQRDVREPTAATTISQFMADLDLRYDQWHEMSKRARP